jgi:beta-glucosidase
VLSLPLPAGFVWGAATSALQIEGGGVGRGASVWDVFAATPGRIRDGGTPEIACDHYHCWPEDLALMSELGLGAYRLSIAWTRILPEGRGRPSAAGLDFYDRLIDALLARGIAPWVTLQHWDLPQALQELGGWPSRDTVDRFIEYTDAVAARLGDRVGHWITHNEPWCVSQLGHREGVHAPGLRSWPASLAAAHHLLLSHGRAVEVLRQRSPASEVGIALNLAPVHAASSRDDDVAAARQFDGELNRWFLDPLFGRPYPTDVVERHCAEGRLSGAPSFLRAGDLAAIAAPIDFLGVNFYSRAVVSADPVGRPPVLDGERTDIGWEVFPSGLSELLRRLHAEWAPPAIHITENGAAYHTAPDSEGRVRDLARIRYLHAHLEQLARAAQDGVPVRGYFVWSLLDNFEWAEGYSQRFGIVWVDFETRARVLKDSAHWYRRAVAANAVVPIGGDV